MKKKKLLWAIIVIVLLSSMCMSAFAWDCVCGTTENKRNFCPDCGRSSNSGITRDANEPYDMGIPLIGNRIITAEQMNMTVFWVQTQLKATGIFYQGDAWDVTGNLGDQTRKEIKAFMQSRGWGGHTGNVDQNVINELATYLGYRIVPVYVGGYYDRMNSIMSGGSSGSMNKIISNMRDEIPHVTIGARWVQCCLSQLGYYTSTIDGKYGEGTERAVMAFQKAYGFQQRDYVTLGVARAMLEACYYSGCVPYDLP